MNYYLIKNKYRVIEYKYPDKFDIIIYYIDENYCQINVKRLDSNDGWGLNLEIEIYNIDNNEYDIIKFGNSINNHKIMYFKTSIKLLINNDIQIDIPKIVLPRKDYLIKNNYELIKETNLFIDFNIVIYYLDDYKIKIIIRRLDNELGWDFESKLILYDYNVKDRKEIITIKSCNNNFKYLFINTKIKVLLNEHNYNQNIPKIIFQTGHSTKFKNILHFNSIISFIELNPEYTYIYYDNQDSRKFLKNYFSDEINYSYDLLVPGAFKADLLRYCFLYNNGGCYFDCKQILRIPIRNFLKNDKDLILCNDVIDNAILNAVIFSTIKNIVLEKTIKDCVHNIINKKGKCALDITGPIFFYKSIKKYINNDNLILQNNRPINDYHDFSNDYYKNFQIVDNYKICVYPNNYNDKFFFSINNNILNIKRIDSTDGWHFNLKILMIDDNMNENLLEIGISKDNNKSVKI